MIADILNVGLTSSGLLTMGLGVAFHERFMRVGEEKPTRVIAATVALMQGQMLIAAIVSDSPFAPISAAAFAVALYAWWSNGGGGGIRRALTAIRSRLSITKTAPQGA